MKKTALIILFSMMSVCVFAEIAEKNLDIGFDLGLGSGFVFYGDDDVKDRNKSIGSSSQIVVEGSAGILFPVSKFVFLRLGADSVLDARWGGGEYVYLWDYCGELGFEIYPGLGGLVFSVDYALGRRTDFFNVDDSGYTVRNTKWGNGFAFSAGYDFGFERNSFAPEIGASWRHMPRGGSSDNIISVFIRISNV